MWYNYSILKVNKKMLNSKEVLLQMCELNKDAICLEISQKILRAMQDSKSFDNSDITLHENGRGNLYFVRNLQAKTDYIMTRGKYDFNVISEDDIKYLLDHKDSYEDDSYPFGRGELKTCRNYIGAKEHLMLTAAMQYWCSGHKVPAITLAGIKNTLLFISIFKNTIVRGSLTVNLRGETETLNWVAIGSLLMFDNGMCFSEKNDKLLSGYPGGVEQCRSRGVIAPAVAVSLTSGATIYKDLLMNANSSTSSLSIRLNRGILLYSLFKTDADVKPPVAQFGLTNKYTIGAFESDLCTDFSDYYGWTSKSKNITLDGYLGTALNKNNFRIIYTDRVKDTKGNQIFSDFIDYDLIDIDEYFNGTVKTNYLDIFDMED